MNKSIALLLAALCMIMQGMTDPGSAFDASDEDAGEIGQGVICDTLQHVKRFVTLRGTGEEPGAALETVYLEANDEVAANSLLCCTPTISLLVS